MLVKKIYYGPAREVFTPIFDGSRMVPMEELRILAAEPAEDAPERLAECILITNETMKDGRTLPVRNYDVPLDVQVKFADSGLPVAAVTDVKSLEDDNIGPHLLATVRFNATRLGEIAWRGVCDGALGGVCAVVLFGTRRGIDLGVIQEVRLGALESSCLSSARIWPVSKNRERSEACPEEDPVG